MTNTIMDWQIDPGVRNYLMWASQVAFPGPFSDYAEQRRMKLEHLTLIMSPRNAPSLAVRDWFIAAEGREIPLRIYSPPSAEPTPLILFMHGGGWVAGSLETHDFLAARLAEGTGSMVVSVHYRRAPENRHPAQLDDCYTALCWAVRQAGFLSVDPERIALVGDSAGGHLATSCAIRARDRGGPAVRFQLLIYPMIEPAFDRASYFAFSDVPGLTRDDCIFFWKSFLGGDSLSPVAHEAVPMTARLEGLPPTAIITAEFDPLRDEGEAYASCLESEGVPVVLRRAPGLIHGFLRAASFSAAVRDETERIVRQLRDALA